MRAISLEWLLFRKGWLGYHTRQLMLISKAWALQLLRVKKARGWHSWDYLHSGQQFEATLEEQDEGLGGCSHELCKGYRLHSPQEGPTVFSLLSRRKVSRVSFSSRSSSHHRRPGKSQGTLVLSACLPFPWKCYSDNAYKRPVGLPSQPRCFTLAGWS